MISALKEFEHFEVVTFDVEILGRIPIDAVSFIGSERRGRWCLCLTNCISLARPGESVALLPLIHFISEDQAQFFEINSPIAFYCDFWKQRLKLIDTIGYQVF